MKNLLICISIIICLSLFGCCNYKIEGDTTVSSSIKIKQYGYNVNHPNNSRNIETYDTQTIFDLCKDFISEFNFAVFEHSTLNPEKYIHSKALMEYVRIKQNYGETITKESITDMFFGIQNINWYDDYVVIKVTSCIKIKYGGIINDENLLVIIQKKNRYFIADWTSTEPLGFDNGLRIKDYKNLNNPNFWENEKYYIELLEEAREVVKK